VFQVSGFVAKSDPVDTFNLVAMDSIQLVADEAPLVYPDSTMDGFNYRLQFDFWSRSTGDSLAGAHDFEIRLSDGFTAILNADLAETIRFQHSDSAKSCDVTVANSFEASNVEMDFLSGGCPLGGSVTLTSAIASDCQGAGGSFTASVDGVWTVHALFNGVTESYTVTDGSTVWTYSEPCGPAAAMSWRW
jgi:hypothetical protein